MTSEFVVRIDQRGRVVVPSTLREKMDINSGDMVMLSLKKDKVTIEPSAKKGRMISKNVFEV